MQIRVISGTKGQNEHQNQAEMEKRKTQTIGDITIYYKNGEKTYRKSHNASYIATVIPQLSN